MLDGRDLKNLSDEERSTTRNRNIGFIFQSFNLVEEMTVERNVQLALRYGSLSASQQRTRIGEVLERLQLSHRARHHPSQLSGGQQQRVAIARAIAARPALLLADEPTGNLDEDTADEVLALAHDLVTRSRCGFLMVTHSARLAATLDRQVTLHAGLIA